MKPFSLFSILIFTLCGVKAQSQKADSVLQILKRNTRDTTEVKALLWLGVQSSKDDIQSARNYFKRALQLSEKKSSPKFIAQSCIELGELYHSDGQSDSSLYFNRKALSVAPAKTHYVVNAYQGIALNLLWMSQFDSAQMYLKSALSIAEEIKDYNLQAGVYNDLGNVALQENDKLEALKQYLLSAKLQDSLLNDPVGLARSLLNIGNIQYQLNNDEKAIQYATEARQIAEKNNYDKGIAYASQLMGRIYRSQKKLDEALIEFTKALDRYRRMGDKRSSAETQLSIGNIYFDKSNFTKAQFHYFNALQEAKSISNQTLEVYLFSALAYVFYEQKLYEKSAIYADSSRISALKINDQYSVLDAYDLLRGVHEKQHHYKEALNFALLHSVLKDSLTKAGNQTETEELEIKYQNEKKVAEIELLKSDQNLKEAVIDRQRTIQIAIVLVLLLVIIIALVLINRYRLLNRARRMVEIERMRNTIARDLHDDIGSTLSSINILSQVALAEKGENVQNYLQRIGDQSARIMEDMSDIVWSINPHNDSMSQIIIRMREFSTEIFESKNVDYRFSEKVSEGLTLDSDKRKNLFLIFKETINNAAKYSNASKIEISLIQIDHTLVMQIKDNGQGFDEHTIQSGNGLRNLRERAKEINGTVTLKSVVGEGTELELRLPIA